MLIKDVRIENAEQSTDIRIKDGKFFKFGAEQRPEPGEEVIDGKGRLVLPPFIESHVHLDACLTAGEPRWNMSGTLFEGIDCWEERKPMLTREDIREIVETYVTTYKPAGRHGTEKKTQAYEKQMMEMLSKKTENL